MLTGILFSLEAVEAIHFLVNGRLSFEGSLSKLLWLAVSLLVGGLLAFAGT